jgi:hypothetical protein
VKVYVNNREVILFRGASVTDAVRAFSPDSAHLLESGALIALDRFGNETDPGGELSEGAVILLVTANNNKP